MTAEEYLDTYITKESIPWSPEIDKYYGAVNTCMIEFARYHCEEQLKAISESRCLRMYNKNWYAQSLFIN